MSNKWFQENKDKFFKKYSDKEILKDIEQYKFGNSNLSLTFRHFFDEVMYKAVGAHGELASSAYQAKTPWDFINDDSHIEYVLQYINRHKTFFSAKKDEDNIKSYFRNAAPRKVGQFPVKQARKIIFDNFPDYDLFEEPLNIHDPSCGFGSRMSAVLLEGCNYYGTDPNVELFECLHNYFRFFQKYHLTRGVIDIMNHGSEVFVPEWENMMDISFTSPPYFNLEIYSNDSSSSTKNYHNYELWKEEYMLPTCRNIKRYIKKDCLAIINTKNVIPRKANVFKNMPKIIPIFDDFVKCFESLGMARMPDISMKNKSKSWNKEETFNEPIMVFKKDAG